MLPLVATKNNDFSSPPTQLILHLSLPAWLGSFNAKVPKSSPADTMLPAPRRWLTLPVAVALQGAAWCCRNVFGENIVKTVKPFSIKIIQHHPGQLENGALMGMIIFIALHKARPRVVKTVSLWTMGNYSTIQCSWTSVTLRHLHIIHKMRFCMFLLRFHGRLQLHVRLSLLDHGAVILQISDHLAVQQLKMLPMKATKPRLPHQRASGSSWSWNQTSVRTHGEHRMSYENTKNILSHLRDVGTNLIKTYVLPIQT